MVARPRLDRSLDYLTLFLLLFVLFLAISGGFSFTAGPIRLTVKHIHHFLLVLLVVFLLRWLLIRLGRVGPFTLSPRWKFTFLRLLEVGLLVHLVLIPIVFRQGDFHLPFLQSPSPARSLGMIFILVMTRLIMGRNFKGLTLVISTTVTLVIAFYGLEFVLRAQESHQLREQEAVSEAVRPEPVAVNPAGKPAAPVPDSVPAPTEKFDPTLNDGVHWTWGHQIGNNRYGFRDDDFAVPKPDNLFRIMILGDSLTWGTGLAKEQRFTDLLEARLSEALPDQPVEVLNFGFQGGPTVRERDLLVDLGDEVDPDLVVVAFCFNDPQPWSMNFSNERANLAKIYGLIAKLRHVGLKKTYAFLINRIDHLLDRLDLIPTWQEALDRTYQSGSREWRDFENALGDIKDFSDHKQLAPPVFILLIQGMAGDNPDPTYVARWFAQAGSAADRNGFVVVDPTARFLEELTMSDLPVNPRDSHPSAACNRIYADQLFDAVWPLVKQGRNGATRPDVR